MGAVEFGPSNEGHLEEIAALLGRVFGAEPDAPLLDRRYLRWKYYDDWPERRGSRSCVLTENGTIVAHAAIWPVRLRVAGGTRDGISFGDWVAAEQHRGFGLTLLKRLTNLSSFVLVTGGAPITRAILPRAGFASWGDRQVYARVVRPVKQGLSRKDSKGIKEPLRIARNWVWSIKPLAAAGAWRAEDAAPGEELIHAAGERPGTVHSAGYLEYMLRCPTVQYRFLAIWRGSEPKGYAMIGTAGGQVRIAELRIGSGEQADWNAAVGAVCRKASADPATCEITAFGSTPELDAALVANGFQNRGNTPVVVFDRERTLVEEPMPQLGLLEDDAASLYDAGAIYRT